MILILGGYAQGRLRYAMKNYNLTKDEIWDAAGETPWQGQKLIYHAEELVTHWLAQEKEPLAEVEKLLPLWEDAIVITQEVGCGLVPIAPEDRAWREAVGRVNCRLAAYAETVERVCCGLGMTLKGAH